MKQSTDPKGWIRGNTKIGPVLAVTTSYLQGQCGVEIRIESVNKDNSHSWVRISHGRQDKKFFISEAQAILAQAIYIRNVDEVSHPAVLVDLMGKSTVGER